jgi:hypothetical protein
VKFRDELTLTPVIGVWSKKREGFAGKVTSKSLIHSSEGIFSVAESWVFNKNVEKFVEKASRRVATAYT